MGKSPKEEKADELYNNADATYSARQQQLTDMSNKRMEEIMSGIDKNFTSAQDYLNKSTRSQVQGMGKQLGESLFSQGVAPGADTGNAWVANMSPIYAQNNASMANLYGSKMNLTASAQQSMAQQLMQMIMGNWNAMDATKMGAMQSMKDSTTFGDVMSVVSPIAQMTLAALTGGGSVPLMAALGGDSALSLTDLMSGSKSSSGASPSSYKVNDNSMEFSYNNNW